MRHTLISTITGILVTSLGPIASAQQDSNTYQTSQLALIQQLDLQKYNGLPAQILSMSPDGIPTATPEQNQALKTALTAWESSDKENLAPLANFAANNPQSPWTPGVLYNLGKLTYHRGMFSKTLEHLDTAWNLSKNTNCPLTGAIAADYTAILARIGRMDDIDRILNEAQGITITDVNRVMMERAQEALWNMRNRPEGAFSCGPYALKRIKEIKSGEPLFGFIEANPVTKTGFNLKALEEMSSQQLGMPMQAVRRAPGAALVFPCVAHWKVNHYGAITAFEYGHYKLDDVTFENSTWMKPEVLDAESSGLFMIPAGELPPGYTAATEEEKETTFGKGLATGSDTSCTTTQDSKCGGSASLCGMATYSFHTFMTSLSVTDTPVWQESPVGPAVPFQVTFNQQEAGETGFSNYSNTSSQWVNGWTSYLVENPSLPTADVKIYLPGGGAETHKTFNSGTSSFAKHPKSETVLKRLSSGVYQRTHADGSIEIYSRFLGTSNPRRVFLTSVKDAQGNTVTLNYDGTAGFENRLLSITDAAGRSMTLSYEDTANPYLITKATNFRNQAAVFSYTTQNGKLRLTSITDIIGMVSSFNYDGAGRLLDLQNPYGKTQFASGTSVVGTTTIRWVQATDPEGSVERLEYNNNTVTGGPTAASGAAEKPNSVDNFTSSYVNYRNTYFWDKKTMHHFGADYSKAVVTNWNHTDVTAIATGVPGSIKKPFENRIWFRYPGQPVGNTVYAGTSNQPMAVVRKIDATNNQEVRFEYNSLGNITKQTDALGRETLIEYAANGIDVTAVKQKNAAGGYDTLQILTYGSTPRLPSSVTDAAGQTTSFTYNARGQVLTITNALAETSTIEYEETPGANGYWDVKKVTGPVAGNETTLTYDNQHRIASITGPDGLTISYEYDGFDRVVKTTYPDGTFEEATYDRLDLRSSKDREGKTTLTWYNHLRQPIITADELGQKTQYEWCKCGKLQRLIDPKGNHTKWVYDIQGRNTSKVYADSRTETFGYDPATSRLTSFTDPKGQVKTIGYNNDDSIASVTYTNATVATPGVSYTYDPKYPRPLSMTDGIGTTSLAYYPVGGLGAGKVSFENGPLAGDIDKIAYTYDALGRLKKTNIGPLGTENTEEATFDSLGRATGLTNNLGTFGMAYIGQTSRPDSISYPNGQKTSFDYFGTTGDLRLKTIHNLKVGTDSGSTLSRFDYTYSPAGEILTWKRQFGDGTTVLPSSTFNFGYDKTGQLTSAVLKADILGTVLKKFSYLYDPMGNRTSSQANNTVTGYTNNAANQTTATSGSGKLHVAGTLNEPSKVTVNGVPAGGHDSKYEAFVPVTPGTNTLTIEAEDYSPNANTATKSWSVEVTGGTARSFTYDTNGNTLNDGIRQYEWDAENRLTKITKGTDVWEFSYDGASRRVLEKKNGTTSRRWSSLGTRIAQELNAAGDTVLKRYYNHGEQRIGGTDAGLYYYTRDHLGSLREMTDSSGTVRVRNDYDPYGVVTKMEGDLDCQWAFTGHYYDPAIGLHLTLFRAYDQATGKWLSPDPLREKADKNLYRYAENSCINVVDPLGLWTVDIYLAAEFGVGLHFGYNGGQIQASVSGGAGAGTSISFDASDSGCRKEGTQLIAEANATYGNIATGAYANGKIAFGQDDYARADLAGGARIGLNSWGVSKTHIKGEGWLPTSQGAGFSSKDGHFSTPLKVGRSAYAGVGLQAAHTL